MGAVREEDQPGHAFLSYVREDAAIVDRLQPILEAYGIRVWRDVSDLWPGEEWKLKIRQAIERNSLAFIACFSPASFAKELSYQREEILLAVDQFRQRPPDRPWLIPVRFGECEIPSYDLGAGRTLSNLQRTDLFDNHWDTGVIRLGRAVQRIIESSETRRPVDPAGSTETRQVEPIFKQVKSMLCEPSLQIELEDLVIDVAHDARARLLDTEEFPINSSESHHTTATMNFMVTQCMKYWETVQPLCESLTAGCAWGSPDQEQIWRRAIEAIANTATAQLTGQSNLLDLRHFPALAALYAGGLSATHRHNYGALRSLAIDAQTRTRYGEDIPLIGNAPLWLPFESYDVTPQILAHYLKGGSIEEESLQKFRNGQMRKLYTPVSDSLFALLREMLHPLIIDDLDYERTFVRLEVLLDLVAVDAKLQARAGVYLHGPSLGSYTWRGRQGGHDQAPAEEILSLEYDRDGSEWRPLRAGLFGHSMQRVEAAFEQLLSEAREVRRHRF